MKYLLTFFILASIAYSSTGQNVLILKTGEKLNGKVEKFSKDTLTFIFKGNKMQFKSSEIVSVYFDEKKVPAENVTSLSQTPEPKQDGKIGGVVTYFFNDNLGDKPDVGANILIINSKDVPDFNLATVDSFRIANSYKIIYSSYARRGTVPNEIKEKVKDYKVETQAEFDALDGRAENELYKIKFSKIIYCTKVAVDGNGTYSANLAPGKYYVYITSNNRKGKNMTEVMGKVYCKEVVVKPGETANLNAKFDLY